MALNKPAWQSSITHQSVACHAVDGNRSADTGALSCSVTVTDNSPWWIVDLESQYNIYRVVITLGKHGNFHLFSQIRSKQIKSKWHIKFKSHF